MADVDRIPLEQNFPVPDDRHVREAVSRLVNAFDPLRILVFGSYARSEPRPGSDLDLLVVLPEVENKREAAVAMRRALADLPVSKDVVATTPEEIERRRRSNWHIVGVARREGQIVYSKSAEAR